MSFFIKRKRVNGSDHLHDGNESPDPGKRKKLLLLLLLLLLFLLLASNLLLFNRLMKSRTVVQQQRQVIESVQEPPDESSEVSGAWYGLCEKNSIHSISDFQKIVENDPVLKKHFSDFNWENARMGRLEEAVWAHLAYRKNDRISTTRRAIRLPKGDGYITDGKRSLRTYCCNDYVQAGAPPDELASAPEPPESPPVPPPTVVPEPSPLVLMGAGIAILGMITWWRRHRLHNSVHMDR
jgi:hypothetical protein